MGNWNINIRGVGQHHSGMETDADKFAERFAQEMRDAGHSVASATITYGGMEDKTPTGPSQKTYFLNGKQYTTRAKRMTYEEICELAGHAGRDLSVTYSAVDAQGKGCGGIVTAGASIPVYERMHIDAMDTSNA